MAGSPEADAAFLRTLDDPKEQPEMLGYIAEVILGKLRIPGFCGWDVCLEDTFAGSVGEIHYDLLLEILHDVSDLHTTARMSEAAVLVDKIMRWCLEEGLRTGIHLGKLIPRNSQNP